jgi:hypothetical protein
MMSALGVICTPDAAHVLTDGSMQAGSGERLVGSKISIFAHARAVHAGRGCQFMALSVVGALNLNPSLDEMADKLPGVVSSSEELWRGHYGVSPADSEHLLAGWSERLGAFCACLFTTVATDYAPARQLTLLDEVFLSPPVQVAPVETLDVPAIGRRILQCQRDADPERVGGFAQLTSVYADRIDTQILERWPEVSA